MLEDQIFETLGPVITTLGADLLEVDFSGGHLMLVVDAEGGISSDKVAQVNRTCSLVITQQELIKTEFTIAATSPGLERNLKTKEHFARAVGSDVSVRLGPGSDISKVEGRLVSFDDDILSIEATEFNGTPMEKSVQVSYLDVAKAKTVFDWKAAFKADKKKK